MRYTCFSCRVLCLAIDFLIDNIYVRFGNSVFRQVIGIPMGTNSAPLLADLSLHTFEYDFMVKTMKQDTTKAIQFRNTFRYIDDLFSINNVDFGNYISAIYPPELQLTDTSTSSTEVCCLVTNIKSGSTNTPFRISIYDKRDDFIFRIVNFPHMDSNIPANPAYSVYISQLVRYARICTSKVDFMNTLRGLLKQASPAKLICFSICLSETNALAIFVIRRIRFILGYLEGSMHMVRYMY